MQDSQELKQPLVAVTGASGLVGRRLVQSLVMSGFQVLALVRDVERAQGILNAYSVPSLKFARFDLDDDPLRVDLEHVWAVVHAGAYIPRSLEDPSEALECWTTNSLGTLRLLEQVRDAGVPYFVYLSAGNAYGASEARARETDPLYPSARAPYYLTSKVAGEVFVDYMRRRAFFGAAILRPAAIYGPGMPPGGLVSSMLGQLRSGQSLNVHDGGRYHVDLVHVDDVVKAIMACLDRKAEGTYNVGSGQATSTLELAKQLLEIAGLDLITLEVTGSMEGPNLGFPALDITLAREQLGYSPTNLRDGLQSMLRESAS